MAFLGNNYYVIINNRVLYLSGTSASAPFFAAMISLINAELHRKGLGPVGFVNPTLYSLFKTPSNYSVFHDITIGDSKCCRIGLGCCSKGFTTTRGWDPITGLGSIDFTNFATSQGLFIPYTPPEEKKKSFWDKVFSYVPMDIFIVLLVVIFLGLSLKLGLYIYKKRNIYIENRELDNIFNAQIASFSEIPSMKPENESRMAKSNGAVEQGDNNSNYQVIFLISIIYCIPLYYNFCNM